GPAPLQHERQPVDHHIQKAADQQAQHGGQGDAQRASEGVQWHGAMVEWWRCGECKRGWCVTGQLINDKVTRAERRLLGVVRSLITL
ncbi:MAG: hypothetical protein KGZ57_02610, partial [Dethiobacter sp.]|nr:hypothetical protein [Dethiobacter sp.]